MCTNSERNKIIAEDIRAAVQNGRTPIILSERVSHITDLKELLGDAAKHVVLLTGKGTAKQKREVFEQLSHVPANESLIVLATGKYAGEGFDIPRLDTLFLAMPISWKGVLSQYCGRLHRKYDGKIEVQIYDYVDFRIPVFERMYQKRLKGYAQLGYEPQPKPNANGSETETPALFSGNFFMQNFLADIATAQKQIIISSPYLSHEKVTQFILAATEVIRRGVKIIVALKNSLQGARAETTWQDVSDSVVAQNIFDSRTSVLIKQLQHAGCTIKCAQNLAQKFAVIDTHTVWYGSCNLLGFTAEDDCMMRLCDSKIGAELESVVWGGGGIR